MEERKLSYNSKRVDQILAEWVESIGSRPDIKQEVKANALEALRRARESLA